MNKARLHRSELAVPGTNVRAMEKAPTLGADVVFLDLEDAVAPDDKERARANVIEALGAHDWSRLRGERARQRSRHALVLPRHRRRGGSSRRGARHRARAEGGLAVRRGVRRDAARPDRAAQRLGSRPHRHPHPDRDRGGHGRTSRRSRARGPTGSRRWCSGSPTTQRACRRARRTSAAPTPTTRCSPTRPGRRRPRDSTGATSGTSASRAWSRRAAHEGLRPIDGPFGDFADADGYRSAARSAGALGCEGKWAIHPSQVELANEVFTPAEPRSTGAERILQAMEEGAKEGKGAVSLDGRLIDAASIRMAENLMRKVEQMRAR